jgi:hypothetical protein
LQNTALWWSITGTKIKSHAFEVGEDSEILGKNEILGNLIYSIHQKVVKDSAILL